MNFLKFLFSVIEMESVRLANHKIQYSIDRGGESKIMLLVRTSTTTTVKSCRNAICRQKEVRDCTSSHAKRIYEPECKINAIFCVDKLEENIKATNPFD